MLGQEEKRVEAFHLGKDRCSWENKRRKRVAGECWLLLLVLKMLIIVFSNHLLLKESCTIFSHNEKPHSYLVVLYSLLAGSVDYHSVQFSLVAQLCSTLCNPMDCSTPGLPVHHQLPEFTQTHVHWVGDAIQPAHPLSSPSPPAFIFSSIRLFSNESVLHSRWPKYWSFSFSISPSNEYSGLIAFMMDLLNLLEVERTLQSLLQHHSSKASILSCSAFFIVQLSHPYMTTGKTTVLTRQTFVGKVVPLLFNMLSGLFITFLLRRKRLSISCL